ncbi:MAG: alpha-L-fucosidase [Gemmatimonadaceae bacterium]
MTWSTPPPFHRDALKSLADAARAQGLRFGVYYSIMDWHHPDAQAPNTPEYNSRTWSNPNFSRHVETYMKPQLAAAVYLLSDRKPLVVEQVGDGFVVKLPAVAPSSIASVLMLEGAVAGQ